MDREAWHATIHGVTKSRTQLSNRTDLFISPFISVNICLIYWGTSMLGAYIFIVFSSWIDPLIIMYHPSLSLLTVFEVYFVWYKYWLLFQYSFDFYFCGIPFSIPSLSICMCLYIWKESFLGRKYMSPPGFISIQPV